MKILSLWAVLAYCSGLLPCAPEAFAQNIAQPEKNEQKKDDLSNLPDEYIDEALAFFDYCESKITMRQHYDCRCLSARYLDKRVEFGAEANRSSIMMAIEEYCPDATEAAGVRYGQCMTNRTLMPPEIPAKEFCECYANTYSKLYERYNVEPNSRTFVKIQSQALLTCRNPEMAKKLYPYQP